MHWERRQKVFDPSGQSTWMDSYAQNPNALELSDRIRIYFTCRPKRDTNGTFVSYTAFVDVEKKEPFKVIEIASEPCLSLGGPGDFDEFGIMPGSVLYVSEHNEFWLYYVGWTRMISVPYKWSIGLGRSSDGGKTFRKHSIGPLLGSIGDDPYLQACPRVYRFDSDVWKMWYQSGTGWNLVSDHYESVYVSREAHSSNGLEWERMIETVVPTVVPNECQTSSSYIFLEGKHHLFFSYRHGIDFRKQDKGYRIGHASSADMRTWERDDSLGLDISRDGWDSEMTCYPNVIEIGGEVFMFYCGNYFGRDGFGYAKLIQNT